MPTLIRFGWIWSDLNPLESLTIQKKAGKGHRHGQMTLCHRASFRCHTAQKPCAVRTIYLLYRLGIRTQKLALQTRTHLDSLVARPCCVAMATSFVVSAAWSRLFRLWRWPLCFLAKTRLVV